MARGFERKDVEFQQAEATRTRNIRRTLTREERETAVKHRTIELALARARAELVSATNSAHRHMLEQGIKALLQQLENT